MSESLARRGPDHSGTFADGPLAFGHRRLAIIDLSASADQPMVDAALRLALVFNGTIYNYRELRCVRRFYGMFAFAVWDMRRARLFLARDRFGIKPLPSGLDRPGCSTIRDVPCRTRSTNRRRMFIGELGPLA